MKNLTTAEGGAVLWKENSKIDNNELYKEYMLYSLHGQYPKMHLRKFQLGAWEYDIVYPAYKCNMTDIMASIGLAQLKTYKSKLKRRKEIIGIYDDFLNDSIENYPHYIDGSSSGHLYITRIPQLDESQRNNIIMALAATGISSNVHYKPLPMFTAYKRLGFDMKDYPNAYNMYKNEITLPLHTRLSNDQIHYVIDNYNKILINGRY